MNHGLSPEAVSASLLTKISLAGYDSLSLNRNVQSIIEYELLRFPRYMAIEGDIDLVISPADHNQSYRCCTENGVWK